MFNFGSMYVNIVLTLCKNLRGKPMDPRPTTTTTTVTGSPAPSAPPAENLAHEVSKAKLR